MIWASYREIVNVIVFMRSSKCDYHPIIQLSSNKWKIPSKQEDPAGGMLYGILWKILRIPGGGASS